MDPTEHGHVPYVVILVRAMEDWKKEVSSVRAAPARSDTAQHGGALPKSYTEKQEFKVRLREMKVKLDEENFDEAEAQAYRAWTETTVPGDVRALFEDLARVPLTPASPPFLHLLDALKHFVAQPPYTLVSCAPRPARAC